MHLSTGYDKELASSYVYLSPAELHERTERSDPWAGLSAGSDASRAGSAGCDPGAVARRHPPTLLGRVGAFFAHFGLLSPAAADTDDCDHLWPAEGAGRPRHDLARRSRDPLLDLDLGSDDLYSGRSARRRRSSGAADHLDPLDPPAVRWARVSANRSDHLDTLDGLGDLGSPERPTRGGPPATIYGKTGQRITSAPAAGWNR
jgi:hypothetical protein